MAELLLWRDEWLLHIDPMDQDHREMVRLLNRLVSSEQRDTDSHRDTNGHEVLLQRFEALIVHIREHFAREEAFMRSINFPGYTEHKREHTLQMAYFTVLRRNIASSKASQLEQQDLHEIKMWFLDHVFGEDREYASFINGVTK